MPIICLRMACSTETSRAPAWREPDRSLVVQLVNVPSPTGFEGDMAREFHTVLSESGFRTTLQPIGDERYNAIGLWEGAGGGKTLLFNGHLDTSFGPEHCDDRR